MRLGVDVGGTFTDAVLTGPERSWTAKAPTTPADQAAGVLEAVERVLELAGAEPGEVASFSHGMTIGTNALLERRGARTALLATAGFTDLLEIARQNRVHLYRLCADRPPPLAPPDLRIGVARADRAGRRRRRAQRGGDRTRRRPARRARLRGGRALPAVQLPRRLPRAPARAGDPRGAAGPARERLLRGPAALPRVRALLDHRDRRLPGAVAERVPDPARRAMRAPRTARAHG